MGCASEKAGADCCAKGLTSEVGKVVGKQPTFCEKVKKGVSKIEECKLGQFHKDDIIQLVLKCHLLMHSSWHV